MMLINFIPYSCWLILALFKPKAKERVGLLLFIYQYNDYTTQLIRLCFTDLYRTCI